MLSKNDGDKDNFIKKEEIPEDMLFFERPEIRDVQHPWYLRGFFGWFDKNEDSLINKDEWDTTVEYFHSFYKNGGILTCMDTENGTVLYRERIGASGPYLASPITANGYIYIRTTEHLYAFGQN